MTEGESTEDEEFISPRVVDQENNVIIIEIAGSSEIISCSQDGDKVKTIVHKS